MCQGKPIQRQKESVPICTSTSRNADNHTPGNRNAPGTRLLVFHAFNSTVICIVCGIPHIMLNWWCETQVFTAVWHHSRPSTTRWYIPTWSSWRTMYCARHRPFKRWCPKHRILPTRLITSTVQQLRLPDRITFTRKIDYLLHQPLHFNTIHYVSAFVQYMFLLIDDTCHLYMKHVNPQLRFLLCCVDLYMGKCPNDILHRL